MKTRLRHYKCPTFTGFTVPVDWNTHSFFMLAGGYRNYPTYFTHWVKIYWIDFQAFCE